VSEDYRQTRDVRLRFAIVAIPVGVAAAAIFALSSSVTGLDSLESIFRVLTVVALVMAAAGVGALLWWAARRGR
jgi:hypothetical protein